jgi:hypothetical protein
VVLDDGDEVAEGGAVVVVHVHQLIQLAVPSPSP